MDGSGNHEKQPAAQKSPIGKSMRVHHAWPEASKEKPGTKPPEITPSILARSRTPTTRRGAPAECWLGWCFEKIRNFPPDRLSRAPLARSQPVARIRIRSPARLEGGVNIASSAGGVWRPGTPTRLHAIYYLLLTCFLARGETNFLRSRQPLPSHFIRRCRKARPAQWTNHQRPGTNPLRSQQIPREASPGVRWWPISQAAVSNSRRAQGWSTKDRRQRQRPTSKRDGTNPEPPPRPSSGRTGIAIFSLRFLVWGTHVPARSLP